MWVCVCFLFFEYRYQVVKTHQSEGERLRKLHMSIVATGKFDNDLKEMNKALRDFKKWDEKAKDAIKKTKGFY